MLVALCQSLGPVLQRWRPKWTFPFISEKDEYQELTLEGAKQSLGWTLALLALSAIGFSAEILHIFLPRIDLPSVVLVASWVSGASHFKRPLLTGTRPQQPC